MSDIPFKAGDVVRLKSGGPKMVVTQTGSTMLLKEAVWCEWFDGQKKMNDTFVPEALEMAVDPSLPSSYRSGRRIRPTRF